MNKDVFPLCRVAWEGGNVYLSLVTFTLGACRWRVSRGFYLLGNTSPCDMASRGVTSFSTSSTGCDLVAATATVGAGSDTADGAILPRKLLDAIN